MRIKRTTVLAALAALLLVTGLTQGGFAELKAPGALETNVSAPQTFRYKHKAGQINSYDSAVVQKINMVTTMPGAPNMDMTSNIDMSMDMETSKVTPTGDGNVITRYTTFKMSMSQNGVAMPSPELDALAQKVAGASATMVLSPRGEQKSISFEGLPPELRQLQDSLSNALVNAIPVFPEKAIKPGESWTQSTPLNLQQGPVSLTMDFKCNYTFMGYQRGTKVAVFKNALTMSIAPSRNNMMGVEMTLGGSGKGTGYLYFDQTLGQLKRSDMEMTQDINMDIKSPDGPQKMDMKLVTSATMDHKGTRRK